MSFAVIVVVGGAGYIGSVVVEELLDQDYTVAVMDDLSLGHRKAVPEDVEFYNADMADRGAIEDIASQNDVNTVMHFAALKSMGESMKEPDRYWKHNVVKSLEMFDHWIDAGVDRFVFSSSAGVYGEPRELPVDESHPTDPVNPYGRTKLACEWYLQDRHQADGVQSVSLRYFNAAGAGDRVGEDHEPERHLIPNLLDAAFEGGDFSLFGTDYDTRDGTCLRDFIHVKDLAEAHVKALKRIDDLGCESLNLGTSRGYTVKEVVEAVQSVTGRDFTVREDDPRPGDPAKLVASNDKARRLLDWEPNRDLDTIIEDAWEWKREHPNGY